ncbi:hypothetical protein B0O99DRAFT_523037 [Bisporella sp. PMI_857]|nr:hypothetical protein B0O99DRAFT_523037 [Bisporella sp. PMI_857]
MVSLTEVRASNAQLTGNTTPRVAVFVGATAGIGKATLTQLVASGFPLKAYVVGRDEREFQPFLSEMRNLNPGAELVFLQGQISLMAETKRLTEAILGSEHHINLLYVNMPKLLRPLVILIDVETTEGLELATAVAYYSRQIFIRRLLPLLRAAVSPGADSYSPRIVNILGTGTETADLFLHDLTLKEPGHFSVSSYIAHCGTMTSSCLKRIAEEPENQDVIIIHNHPGLVSTEIFKKSWGGKLDEDAAGESLHIPEDLTRITPQEAGERSLYVITSAKYGGNGVPMSEGQKGGLSVKGTTRGSLLCVGDKLETLQLDLLDSLEKSGAADVIWDKTDELIRDYL